MTPPAFPRPETADLHVAGEADAKRLPALGAPPGLLGAEPRVIPGLERLVERLLVFAAVVTATLTIAGLSSGANWWLKQTAPTAGTCTPGEAGFSHALGSLTTGATYAYTAYSASGCADADAIDSVSFTHILLTASRDNDTSTTLTLTGLSSGTSWWLKQTAPTAGMCTTGETDFSHALTISTPGAYVYKAYSASGCADADAIASVAFTHATLSASRTSDTSATLTLAGHTGAWSWQRTAPAGGSCANVASGTATATASGLTGGAYAFTAYSGSGCAAANTLAPVAYQHPVLTASNVSTGRATLTLSGHTGNWWFKQTAPPGTQCATGEADFSNDLTTLSLLTSYTFTAYSDSTCTTELDSVSFTTTGFTVGNNTETTASEVCRAGDGGKKCAIAFTTGPRSDGYTLLNLDIYATTVGTPTAFTYFPPYGGGPVAAIHAANGDDPAADALSRLYLLGVPGLPISGICLTSCDLTANTTYFLVLSDPGAAATAGNYYSWTLTSSNAQAVQPAGNGWTIADAGRADTGSGWAAIADGASSRISISAGDAPSVSFGSSTIAGQAYARNAAITTLTLPAATAAFGTPTITYSVSPALPAGLSFDATTRQLSGTPSAAASSKQYTYTATTGGATATLTFSIVITDVPAKPSTPTLTAGQGHIAVAWTAPAAPADDPITDYDVGYCWLSDCESASNWHTWTHDGTALTATITGLDSAHTYRVRVRAENGEGESEWSDLASTRTTASKPDAPGNLTVVAHKITDPLDTWLGVDWDKPSGNGAKILEYEIRHRVKDAANWTTKRKHGTGYSSTSITAGITFETTYEVQVRARNAVGWGDWTAVVEVTTPGSD